MKPVSSGMRSGIEVLYGCWQVGSLTIEGVEATVLTGCIDCRSWRLRNMDQFLAKTNPIVIVFTQSGLGGHEALNQVSPRSVSIRSRRLSAFMCILLSSTMMKYFSTRSSYF